MRNAPRKPNCVKYQSKMLFVVWTANFLLLVGGKLIPSNGEQNQLLAGVPIEQKSWFETQMLAAAQNSMYNNLGDIMVFDGGTWNPYPTCRSCGKFQNYRTLCQNKAEYLNLCGECVGGSSEKDDDYGLDSCGICAGLERCGQLSCEDSIEENFESTKNQEFKVQSSDTWQNVSVSGECHLLDHTATEVDNQTSGVALCMTYLLEVKYQPSWNVTAGPAVTRHKEPVGDCSKVIGIRPKVIDMAGSSKGVIHLIGNVDKNNMLCSIYIGATEAGKATVSETEWGLEFEFDLPKKEGRLDMHCNTSEGVVLMNSLLVVDSRKLQPLSSEEKSIEFGKESQVTLSVANMIAMADLLCFAQDEEGSVQYKSWSNEVQGNSLSSNVACGRIWPKKAGKMKFGVAYSAEAIPLAKTLDIEVVSKDLTLLWATASKGKLILHFDQVIETSTDCGAIFKTISDNDAKCWNAGNEIRVKFYGSPKVKTGDTLQVSVASASMSTTQLFSVKIDGNRVSEPLSNLEINGPEVVCSNQKVTFDVDGSSVKWSLAVPNNTASYGSMTTGNKQRKNMMMWRSVRETSRMMKTEGADNRISLNTTLLTPGDEYQIKATLPDRQGKAMTVTKNFKIATDSNGQPMIKGPSNPTWTNEALYELENPTCGSTSANIKYEWLVGTADKALIQQSGFKMRLKPGILSSNTKYNLTVKLLNDSQIVSEVALEVLTQPATLKAATYLNEIVFGTGHKIVLLGNSKILPTKSIGVNYQWICESETGPCLMPGEDQKSVETIGGFDSSVLVLPPGSLPVGKYLFTLNVSLASGESTSKSIRVFVVPGEPTLLSLVSINFEENLKITLQAKDIIGECEINLESLKAINTSYLELSELVETHRIKGTPSNPLSKTLLLDVHYDKLIYGTSYMFQLSADCGALSQSWMTFSIPVPEKSSSCELAVNPTSGVALSTEFTFQVTDCYPTNPIYSFGYLRNDKVYYLTSTLDPQKKLFSFPGTLKPLMKICEPDKMCAVYFGENITVETSPVDAEVARAVIGDLSDDFNSGHFEEVLGTTALLLESCAVEPDLLKNVTASILQIIVNKINDVSAGIDQGGKVTFQTLDLLQCALEVVKDTDGSDEVITVILKFRDKIEEKAKQSADIELHDKEASSRDKRSITVTKRETDESPVSHKVEVLLKSYSTMIPIQKDPASLKNQTNRLLEKIPDYMLEMCNGIKRNEKPLHVENQITELTTLRVIVDKKDNKMNVTIPECLDTNCSDTSMRIVMYQPLLDQLKSPDGICLGVNYLKDDYYSLTRNVSSESNITRWSGLYKSMVFKYEGNAATNFTSNSSYSLLATIRIPLWNMTIPKDTQLRCHLWKNDFGWNFNPCSPVKPAILGKLQALECRCPFPGVYAVFAVPKSELNKGSSFVSSPKPEVTKLVTTLPPPTKVTTLPPPTKVTPLTTVTTSIPSTLPTTVAMNTTAANKTAGVTPHTATVAATTSNGEPTTVTSSPTFAPESYKVAASFMINENFNETVGDKQQEFENSIKSQLIKTVQIPYQSKVDAVNDNENIKVVVNMRYAEKTDVSKLQTLLNSGELRLRGLNNTELKVPKQHLELVLGQKDGRSSTFAVVSAAIFISLTFIMAILLSGMFLKWKRQQRALSFVQNMEISAPKYLRLHETTSIERIETGHGSTENLRSGDLDSGIVLTVDPNRMSTKYHTGNGSGSRHTVA